ncbi:MAG: alpha-L-fucosidase, partial [Acidobacteria bacterium]|nr:alpha-L-fucosidase [Acidobacteriota bacterium]
MRRLLPLLLACAALLPAQNDPERIEWFRDLGFGLFLHWSLDSQVGSVISHSLVGADEEYIERFQNELPRSFNPTKFDAKEWARLAKLAGFRYVVFTAKHHSGFCMFHTETTDYSIEHTPFERDVTREIVEAFREEGIAIGIYFSPDDFHFLHNQGTLISRRRPEVLTNNNPALLEYDRKQVRELYTKYGSVEVFFIDGEPEGLKQLAWEIQPKTVVTRGEIETPEQYTPGLPLDGPWEGNLTMGVQWQYRPTNDTLKSGTELIETLVETRAKGGNLLLNIAPHPDGDIPKEQADRLREIALWMMVNRDSIYGTRTWIITNEGPIWFTKKKDEKTVYAFVTGEPWKYAE